MTEYIEKKRYTIYKDRPRACAKVFGLQEYQCCYNFHKSIIGFQLF